MRFIVEYTRPSDDGQIEGVKMFDVHGAEDKHSAHVLEAAQDVAGGERAQVTRVYENNGRTDLGEHIA